MSGKFLLDTNIVIAIFAKDAAIQIRIADAAEVFIPVTVIGELYYGAHKSARVKANLERIEEFAAINTILICDTKTAQQYGEIKSGLRAKGSPIPENDIWIAAIAKQYGLIVATRDGHFGSVEDLLVEGW
ncbi:MAG: type II toxin-antitoxin system VapC family toxin [Pyrinomonadaceae bacterium]